MFLDDLRKNGIKANVSISKTENTGVVFVVVFPGGQRFFINDRGANAQLKYEEIALDLIRDSRYLFFSGYSFQDKGTLDCIGRLLDITSSDTSIVFNPGAPNLVNDFRESFCSLTRKYVNILILNEAEARYLTQCDAEKEILACLLSLADTVVLTMGERGSIVAKQNELYTIEANPTEVVDTTGCGDAYTAGVIYGLSCGKDIKTTGEFASKIAAQVAFQIGARIILSGLIP